MKTTFLGSQAMGKGAAVVTALALVLSFVPAFPSVAEASTTVTLGASKDAWVDQNNPTENHGNDTLMEVRSRDGSRNKRALVEFSLSSLPTGATIQSATLTLSMKNAPHAPRTYNIHRITSSWIEGNGGTDNNPTGEVRWNNQPASTTSATSATSTGATNDVDRSWDVTSDVQAFIDGSASNFGWLIKDASENSSAEDLEGRFRTRENTDSSSSKQPKLVITYTPAPTTGNLTITKTTIGGNGTFNFTLSGTSTAPSITTSNNTGSVTVFGLAQGSYTVTEAAQAGWDQTGNPSTDCVNVQVSAGNTATCTITNTKRGSITVVKDVVAPDGETNVSDNHGFNVTLDGGAQKSFSENTSYTFENVLPGSHTVAEVSGDPDFDLLRISGDNDQNASNGAPVTVTAGQNTTITITNAQKKGHLTVIKHVNHPNGGTAVASAFIMSVSGTNVSTLSFPGNDTEGTTVTLDPGEFSVGETGPSGYSLYSNEGTCSGTIGSNGNLTCIKTNSDIPVDHGAITVIKHVVNTHGGGLSANNFTVRVKNGDADVPGSPAQGSETGQLFTLASSTSYTVSEDAPASGYAETGISCVPIGGGETLTGQTVTIENLPDQKAYICTITNDDLPGTLHVVKRLINDNGGTAATSTFSFSVNQETPVFFNENGHNDFTVASSTYSVTETATSTYATTYRNSQNVESNDCANLRIVNGEEATCTITNTFVPTPHDITPPVSTFDNGRDHQTIDTELVQLSLSGTSTDAVGPQGDPRSGVASAAMSLYKLADAQTMDGEGFFSHTFPGLSCSTSTLVEQVPTEIVALSLTSTADPLTVTWDPVHQTEHPLSSLDRGVYCAVVHATDNAGNVENTATAGPFAYTFTPSTPTPTPPSPPSTPPVVNNGAISPIFFGNGSVLGASTSTTGQVLGASCGLYMDQHLKKGSAKNKPDQVTKLQQFLNKNGFGKLALTGTFGSLTEAAVKAFQSKYADEILKPWGLSKPTGLVYLTTIRQLNLIECPDLTLPSPALVPWDKNPNAQ